MMKLTFELKPSMECPICEQLITYDSLKSSEMKLAIIIAAPYVMKTPYSICKGCGRVVEEITPDYIFRSNKPRVFADVG